MNSIEDVLTALLFKYAGLEAGYFVGGARMGPLFGISNTDWSDVQSPGRPEGAVDFCWKNYTKTPYFKDDRLAFADSTPSNYEPDPTHPWRAEIRAELVELFDLIFEKPMTEVLYLADPTGGELERELKHMRRKDP